MLHKGVVGSQCAVIDSPGVTISKAESSGQKHGRETWVRRVGGKIKINVREKNSLLISHGTKWVTKEMRPRPIDFALAARFCSRQHPPVWHGYIWVSEKTIDTSADVGNLLSTLHQSGTILGIRAGKFAHNISDSVAKELLALLYNSFLFFLT